MKIIKSSPCKVTAFTSMLLLSVAISQAPRAQAQVQPQPDTPNKVAVLHEASPAGTDANNTTGAAQPAPAPDPRISLDTDIAKELAAMKARIEQLEFELRNRAAAAQPAPAQPTPAQPATAVPVSPPAPVATASASPALSIVQAASDTSSAAPAKKEKIVPFSDWDWTWLNGNPRNKDTAFDSKFFTPEIRADITYNYDFNKPIDNTIGGSSEIFRSNEIQLEQLGIGGDFHLDNVRARFMTQFGMYSTATVRNDPSYAKGQWDIDDADRYLSEAYGGYHIDG